MSFWRKISLGPLRDVHCASCKNRVGADVVRAHLAFLPALLVLACIPWMRHIATLIGAGTAALALMFALYWWWVPLKKRGLTLNRDGAAVRVRDAASPRARCSAPGGE